MKTIIDALKAYDVIRDDDNLSCGSEDRIEPETVPFSSVPKLDATLMRRLGDVGIQQLFRHQADATNTAMAGNNVVLESPTASGKTLSFAIPVLESLTSTRGGHALFVYPMKAVAFDQRAKLRELHEGLTDRSGRPIESWTYDGDVDADQRRAIRQAPPSILLTNIEYINESFLAYNDIWEKFLDNLKWIVLDEIHEYRGYFGTNAAMVLRRLLHFMKSRNCEPNVFMATATCENPREHANNLTGLDCEVISARKCLRPKRDYLFIDPEIPDHRFWSILQLRASLAARALDDLGMSATLTGSMRTILMHSWRSRWTKLW